MLQAFGDASITDGVPDTPHTRFRLGTLGAPITAAVVLALVDAGRLTLRDRVARWLGVDRRYEPRDLELEAAPLERIAADMLQVTITPASRLHGVEVGELRLPEGASVSMLIREGRSFVPERRTVLRRGDDLLVVTPRKLREATERRLRDVSLGGRLARWLPDE